MAVSRAGTTVERPEPGAEQEQGWVDARPFRAHLRHLMAVGSLDATEVAAVLGLSTRAVHHLLGGRTRRLPRRISPETARQLLRVRAADVRDLRWCLTPAAAAATALLRLRGDGWSVDEVAWAVGFDADEVRALGRQAHCSRLLAVRLVGLARRLPSTVDDDDLRPVPAAA